MSLTSQQKEAVSLFSKEHNVKVIAVPGAGKSRVLIQACKEFANGLCIILAYNRELKEETDLKLEAEGLTDRVMCYTFHGLCSKCIRLTPDDLSFYKAIEDAEKDPKSVVSERLKVDAILIDEAQDFRPSFARLMKLVLNVSSQVQYMVVGDPRQMLYDYNPEDTASFDYLLNAEHHFASRKPWKKVHFDVSHRVTPSMARLVSNMFREDVQSSQNEHPETVQVYTINMWTAGDILWKLLETADITSTCLLVSRRKNNMPLTACLNYLSRRGVRLHLHGIDGIDANTKRKKLSISSWHASKGTEFDCAIVFGLDASAQTNPCFVAMTRGRKRLIILQNEKSMHLPFMKALEKERDDISMDQTTQEQLKRLEYICETQPFLTPRSVRLLDLNEWRPNCSGRWILSHVDTTLLQEARCETTDMTIRIGQHFEDVGELYALALLAKLECAQTGDLQQSLDFRMPIRKNHEARVRAIHGGIQARFVSQHISQETLLVYDLRQQIMTALNKDICNRSSKDYMLIACGFRSWNSYHHLMRQVLPLDWFDEIIFELAFESMQEVVETYGGQTSFDVRVNRMVDNVTFHARVPVYGASEIWRMVWKTEIGNEDILRAALCASLHPICNAAYIFNIPTQQLMKITVRDSATILERIAQEINEDVELSADNAHED